MFDSNTIKTLAAEFSKEFGTNAEATESLLTFIFNNMKRNPEMVQMFLKNPGEFLTQAVTAWNEASMKFFNKLLDKDSPEYKQLCEEVYESLKKRV